MSGYHRRSYPRPPSSSHRPHGSAPNHQGPPYQEEREPSRSRYNNDGQGSFQETRYSGERESIGHRYQQPPSRVYKDQKHPDSGRVPYAARSIRRAIDEHANTRPQPFFPTRDSRYSQGNSSPTAHVPLKIAKSVSSAGKPVRSLHSRPAPIIRYSEVTNLTAKYHYFDPVSKKLIHKDEMSTWNQKGKYPITGFVTILDSEQHPMIQARNPEIKSIDPRKLTSPTASISHRKLRNNLTNVARIVYDKYSVGPPPPCAIIVSPTSIINNTMIQDISIKNYFKKFGVISHFESFNDPNSALPLHIYLIKYTAPNGKLSNLDIPVKSAYQAVKEFKEKGCFIMGSNFNVALNKEKLLEDIKTTLVEENIKKAKQLSAVAISTEKKDRAPIAKNQKITMERPKRSIPYDLARAVNNKPCLFVSRVFMALHGFRTEDFKYKLRRYRYSKFLDHITGLYIVFGDLLECKKCFELESGKMTLVSRSRRIPIEIRFVLIPPVDQLPTRFGGFGKSTNLSPSTSSASHVKVYKTKDELINATVKYILKDLKSILDTDIRKRLIGPTVFDTLNPTNFPELMSKKESKERAKQNAIETAAVEQKKLRESTNQDFDIFNLYGGYTRKAIKKRRTSELSDISESISLKKKKLARPMAHLLNEDIGSKENTPTLESATPFDEFDNDHDLLSSTSSSEAEDGFIDDKQKVLTNESPVTTPETPQDDSLLFSSSKPPKVDVTADLYKPSATEFPETVYKEDLSILKLSTPLSIVDLQNMVRDDEDLFLLKELVAYKEPNTVNAADECLEYAIWKLREWKKNDTLIKENQLKLNEVPFAPALKIKNGPFKAENIRKVPDRLKNCYLPHRRKLASSAIKHG